MYQSEAALLEEAMLEELQEELALQIQEILNEDK